MKYADINRAYTNKVAEYMLQGYRINTNTMRGCGGEIAKVDLTNGTEVIRVELTRFYKTVVSGLTINVGIVKENRGHKIHPDTNCDDIIWETVTIESINYIALGDDRNWYITEEEYNGEIKRKKAIRMKRDWDNDKLEEKYLDVDKYAKIVLPYINRQRGLKTAKLKDIGCIIKATNKWGTRYIIRVKGKYISLRAR